MIQRIWHFYVDGFRNMTVGRILWLIIIIKVIILFAILRVFLFPRSESMFTFKEKDGEFLHERIGRSIQKSQDK